MATQHHLQNLSREYVRVELKSDVQAKTEKGIGGGVKS